MTFRATVIPVAVALTLATQTGCPAPAGNNNPPPSTAERRTATARPAPRTSPRPQSRVVPKGALVAGSHILIAYKGARRARAGVVRSKEEAFRLAARLVTILQKAPKRFADLARKHSDGPTGKRGGFLGSWKVGRMVPAFDSVITRLKIGELAGPVETKFGFHVMKRMPIPPLYAGRHILISYVGAKRARPAVTRTKAQALAFAKKLAKQLQKKPQQFVAMATKHSNGPSAKRGGSLGAWRRGRMVPEFDNAIAKLKIGQVSGVVETTFGYHIIQRVSPTTTAIPTPKPAPRP